MTGKNGYERDKAVKHIKRLPKNRNVPVQRGTYRCALCPAFKTTSLVEAWMHSNNKHGPWPVTDSATLAPLPVTRSPLYNNGMRILASVDAPSIRRLA